MTVTGAVTPFCGRRACDPAGVVGLHVSRGIRPSRRGAQSGQGDRDKSVDGILGGQVARCGEGVEAVAREFVGVDVVPDAAGLGGVGDQVADEAVEVLLRVGEVLVPVHEGRELGGPLVRGSLEGDECAGMEYGFEPLVGGACLITGFCELLQMGVDPALVPGDQD